MIIATRQKICSKMYNYKNTFIFEKYKLLLLYLSVSLTILWIIEYYTLVNLYNNINLKIGSNGSS